MGNSSVPKRTIPIKELSQTMEEEQFSLAALGSLCLIFQVAASISPASIMSNRWILQAAFLLGFLSITLSINYEELERTQRSSNSACLKLLEQLERRSCLGHRDYFKFPTEVKHPGQMEKRDAAFIIQVMVENIFIVFKNDSSSTGWNESIVKKFLGELHAQIEKLGKILDEVPKNERRTSSNYPTIRRLKSYYGRVRRFLEVKEFSSCAWMVVRAEILRNFSILIRLTNIFQN